MHLLLLHAEANITIIPTNIPSFEVSNNFIFIKHYHSKQKKIYTFLLQKFFFNLSFPYPSQSTISGPSNENGSVLSGSDFILYVFVRTELEK